MIIFLMNKNSARGVYYVTTNAKPPFARGFPGKSKRTVRNGETRSYSNEYDGVRRR